MDNLDAIRHGLRLMVASHGANEPVLDKDIPMPAFRGVRVAYREELRRPRGLAGYHIDE